LGAFTAKANRIGCLSEDGLTLLAKYFRILPESIWFRAVERIAHLFSPFSFRQSWLSCGDLRKAPGEAVFRFCGQARISTEEFHHRYLLCAIPEFSQTATVIKTRSQAKRLKRRQSEKMEFSN
jgi:hypothetical protein